MHLQIPGGGRWRMYWLAFPAGLRPLRCVLNRTSGKLQLYHYSGRFAFGKKIAGSAAGTSARMITRTIHHRPAEPSIW